MQICNKVIDLAWQASELLLHYYEKNIADIGVETKKDESPVTIADNESSKLLINGLSAITNMPVISEEMDRKESLDIMLKYGAYWLIDPLDGTYPYIRKRGIFTINIALIQNGNPIEGLILAPLYNLCYYTFNRQVIRLNKYGINTICKASVETKRAYDFILSSRNTDHETSAFMKQYRVGIISIASSAYKFCMLAEGRGDIHPRFLPTCIWDTAAGHAILKCLGGNVVDMAGKELVYNNNIINPSFVAYTKFVRSSGLNG